MFTDSKYTTIYYQIVERAKGRNITGYTENHHIIPKSIGGDNATENMVHLTAREHFICHWLLTKMTSGAEYHSMIHALNGMKRVNNMQERYSTKITSRVYEKIKPIAAKIHSEFMTGKVPHNKGVPRTEAQKQAQREKMLGRKLTPDQLARSIAKRTGMKRTVEQKKRISDSTKGIAKGPMSEENKAKISAGAKGIKKSAESSARKKETLKKLASEGKHHSQIVLTCPHCGAQIKKLLYARWHGDNCKLNLLNSQN